MKQFSDQTQKIIDDHKGDFDSRTYDEFIRKHGGYNHYLRSLGGIFREWAGKTAHVKTAKGLQDIAEYVFGLMSIWGFDYNNTKTYVRWKDHPFYSAGLTGRCNWGRIDDLCSNSKKGRTTNCNYGIDSLLYKAGLLGQSGTPSNCNAFKGLVNNWKCPVIRNIRSLQIGDIIEFFHSPVTTSNPYDWKGWGHVCVVGDIVNGKIILFDAGSRFINSGKYKFVFSVDNENKPVGAYSNYEGWCGIRICNLIGSKDDSIKNRSNSDLAVGILHGEYGSGQDRKDLLQDRYDVAQNMVNWYLKPEGRNDFLIACAMFVLRGYAGNGDIRKEYFGSDYDDVQSKVNWILSDTFSKDTDFLAMEVLNGMWGSGQNRKKALTEAGHDYDQIQSKVNLILS